MEAILEWLSDPAVFRGFFGWGSKRERSLAINNIIAFAASLYCLYFAYYVAAGLFFIYMVIMIILKINIMHKETAHSDGNDGVS